MDDFVLMPRTLSAELLSVLLSADELHRARFLGDTSGPELAAARYARLVAAIPTTPQPASADVVDWRGHFVNVSAMRYMDNGVTKDRAYACAEHDATALAAIKGAPHA